MTPLTSQRRKNLLNGQWVLVSPQRLQRPWMGQVEATQVTALPEYDPDCSLCAGNTRSSGAQNPEYLGAFSFANDYPALSESSLASNPASTLFVAEAETGHCRVLCYSERHDLRLASMTTDQVTLALSFLFREFAELDSRPDVAYVQIFENRGEMMGCSMPHPHAQAWATSSIPCEPQRELDQQLAYFQQTGSCLLLDYLAAELEEGQRIICENEYAVSMVPFWATWPYETLLLPKRQVSQPGELCAKEVQGLASVLKQTLEACEALFGVALPYSMGFHARPSDGKDHLEWQFHAHIYPPLLRSATIRKHLVGFEMLGMPQRDLTPEAAAAALVNAKLRGNTR